ncbi:calycin-like domain-containing protein [Bacteroides eggerthii]|uniref:Calycin-like domain-containing protein n=1 Tax=Bacteroides eggerthii TaxID=28111 RepID=A0ABT7U4H6_9BACE|nr:calycin-like domain-containing protein [Bacteroides eggerthii]
MKKIFTFAALLCATWMNAQGVYQIPNSDFENWVSGKEPGNGWNSFNSARTDDLGFLASIAKGQSPNPQKVEGYNGTVGVKLYSKSIVGAKANGNLTTGKINMGSITPSDAKNYNYTDLSSGAHSLQFAGTPDAVSCMAKFKSGGSPNGRGQFILHDKYGYKDPETSNEAGYENHKIALAAIVIPETSDWKYFEAKFDYTGNVAPAGEQYMLASFTTNPTPGGSDNDELILDDVRLIYYSELASLNYDGQDYFQKGNTNYTIDALYDESKLTCTSNGRGATIEKSYYDEASAVLTITVKGNDVSVNPSNVHTYKVQFAKPQPVITEYENDLVVTINDQSMPSQPATIQLIKEIDGTTSLALNNFALGSGVEAIPVGNIKLTNLEIVDGKIQTTQTITITAGDNPEAIGPILGEIPVTVNATIGADNKMEAVIDIPFTSMGMIIKVTFAETQTYTDGQALSLNTGLTNIAYNRTFPEGWSTVCLPFATPAVAFGDNATSVQEFVSADESGLNFAEVENLEANKPYLIYFAEAKETPTYFGTEITSTTPVSVTKGDYTFVGSYDAVMSMSGKYGIATVDDVQKIILGGTNSTLKATRAYFTKKGEQPAQVRINLFGMGGDGDGTTGIDQIVNGGAQTYDVYTLQGVQVLKGAASLNGLQKGIYIVNGKKVVIK